MPRSVHHDSLDKMRPMCITGGTCGFCAEVPQRATSRPELPAVAPPRAATHSSGDTDSDEGSLSSPVLAKACDVPGAGRSGQEYHLAAGVAGGHQFVRGGGLSQRERPGNHDLQFPVSSQRHEFRARRLDGARLLTWNPPGTPFTDLILNRLGAAGSPPWCGPRRSAR